MPGDASDAEVEQAYRRMISQYHPDKLVGVADELRRLAEDKASEINAAYDRIKDLRKRSKSHLLTAIPLSPRTRAARRDLLFDAA